MLLLLKALSAATKRINLYCRNFHKDFIYKKKVRKLISSLNCKPLTNNDKNKAYKYYKNFNIKLPNSNWHRYYTSILGEFHNNYIPEDLFYLKIEPALNSIDIAPSLEDKNLTEDILSKFKQPKSIIKRINSFYIHEKKIISKNEAIKILKTYEYFFIKKTRNSYGGKDVDLVSKNQVEVILEKYNNDFITQEVLKQNLFLESLNSSSLNTMRIVSYLRSNEIVILASALRIGAKGSHTDNTSAGGFACYIIDQEGTLNEFAFNKKGEKFKQLRDGVLFKDIKVPYFEDAISMVKKMHVEMPYFRLLSWDIAIDYINEPVLIEYNAIGQTINSHQFANGPLFGKYTNEVLEFVFAKK